MRWSIRNQILIPFMPILVLAVATIAITSAYLAARRSQRITVQHLQRVVDTLGEAHFPYTANVLNLMRGLSGADFAAIDPSGTVVASTLHVDLELEQIDPCRVVGYEVGELATYPSTQLGGKRYFAAQVVTHRSGQFTTLVILYPEQRWREAQWEAAWPPLATGAVTVLLLTIVSAWLSRRLSGRIQTVQTLFARIADGDFDHAVAGGPRDELHDLVLSANRLSDQLRGMQQTIRHTERMRLLAQLAGGLAHQMRNAVTGARMAVQLHQRRCRMPNASHDESLDVALRQLSLTEDQMRRLLSLGRHEPENSRPGTLGELLDEVESMLHPACRHARVHWECHLPADAGGVRIEDYEQLRSALQNLTLNALEAAGVGGSVRVAATLGDGAVRLEVSDDGPGPPESVRETLFDPFVTSKPEGVGLGLALAKQTAEAQGGGLGWKRWEGRTVFTLSLPVAPDTRS